MRRRRGNGDALQKIEEPEVALGLGEQRQIKRLAFMEQQKLPQQCGARLDMKQVEQAVDASTTGFRVTVDRHGLDDDAADAKRLLRDGACRRQRNQQQQRNRSAQHSPSRTTKNMPSP